MQNSSTKFYQSEFNNTFKRSHTMINWNSSQGCKDFWNSPNQSMWYTTPTNQRIKQYEYLNRCTINFWQNSAPIYDKNSPESHRGYMCMCAKSLQFCPTLCATVNCSPSGSSVHGILQARILEWVAISFSRGSSQPGDRTLVSFFAGRFFITEP